MTALLEVRDLVKRFRVKHRELCAVDGVSFDIEPGRAAEHQDIQQRVAAEAVGSVHGDTGTLASREQAING